MKSFLEGLFYFFVSVVLGVFVPLLVFCTLIIHWHFGDTNTVVCFLKFLFL